MALVTISGFPCSGKTTRARELAEYLEGRFCDPEYTGEKFDVVVVDDPGCHVARSAYDGESGALSCSCPRPIFVLTLSLFTTLLLSLCARLPPSFTRADSKAEKPARAALFTAVTRNLRPDTITIADSANYIKGYRYQMYCAAREAGVRVATIRIAAPPAKCEEWHAARPESERYAQAT